MSIFLLVPLKIRFLTYFLSCAQYAAQDTTNDNRTLVNLNALTTLAAAYPANPYPQAPIQPINDPSSTYLQFNEPSS